MTTTRPTAAPLAADAGISSGLATLLATTAGFSAANIYYAQPLLTAIARTFGVGPGAASLVVTIGTVGYAVGIALLVPLGDVVNRRRLAISLLVLVGVFQAVSAVSPSIGVLVPAAGVVALGAVVSPLMVAFGATLASADQRGVVTGKIMSGVLIGVLLARTGGGLVAQWLGWRAVYAVAAVLVLVLAVVLHRVLPTIPVAERVRYPALLASTARLLKDEPQLRLRSAYAFLSLAGFNAFWTSLAFLLAEPPYSFSEGVIGMFGVVGAVGAVAARVAGKLVDRGKEHLTTALLLLGILLSWGLFGVEGGGLLVLLLIGVVIIDFGVQGMQVANLGVIYRLRPEARSRLTTAYLTVYFIGGVVGSAASGAAYAAFGWGGVCVVGVVIAASALLLFMVEQLARRSHQ